MKTSSNELAVESLRERHSLDKHENLIKIPSYFLKFDESYSELFKFHHFHDVLFIFSVLFIFIYIYWKFLYFVQSVSPPWTFRLAPECEDIA